MRNVFLLMAAMAMLASCGGGQSPVQVVSDAALTSDVDSSSENGNQPDCNVPTCAVRTMGKVVACRYADLSFETSLPIAQVLVRNGQQVCAGQTLARLDLYKLRNAIEQQERAIAQAQLQIAQADLQMKDVIITQGYDPEKPESVPDDVRHNADVKSGYALAKNQLDMARTQLAAAQHELNGGVLTAPFDGVVANVTVQAHQLAQPGQAVCRVIATGNMAVEFRVMEGDLGKYRIGTGVSIVPVADKSACYSASVSEINPVVDEQGAVTIRARLDDAANLFDGMNVEVILTVDN